MARHKILIVDDEMAAPQMLKRLLERRKPYDVLVEHDSRNAVETARTFQPDVILLDMIMPELDGGDVAAQLRASEAGRDVPIIFISASAERMEGYPFLAKPAPVETVIECIEENLCAD